MAANDHFFKIFGLLACFILFNIGIFLMKSDYFSAPKRVHSLGVTGENATGVLSSIVPHIQSILNMATKAPHTAKAPSTAPPVASAINVTSQQELSYQQFCALKTAAKEDGCKLSSVKVFYDKYRERCLALKNPPGKQYCACFPATLVGWELQDVTLPLGDKSAQFELDAKALQIQPGGHWTPTDCVPRQKVAIIIPYRKRPEQLKVFAHRMNQFMRRQQHEYRIYIVEQNEPQTFSRAALMNVGFLEANKSSFDCFIFSDVDLLPEDDRYMYDCFYSPLHIGAYVSKFNYKTLYTTIFGGISALSKEHVLLTNGFGNRFYGWGGEDDDLYHRVMSARLTLYRYPGIIGRTFMIKHKSDKGNEYNKHAAEGTRHYAREVYLNDGVKQTQHEVLKTTLHPLYTLVNINLLPLKPEPACLQKGANGTTFNTICWGDPNFKSGLLDCCGKGCCHIGRKQAASPGNTIKKIS